MPNVSHVQPIGQVDLPFSGWRPLQHLKDPLHKDLSAVARVGDSLFLACDETASVERLRRLKDGRFGEHRHFALDGLVDLPAGADGEMDIEGLCASDGFLWIVGSHALKRSKPKRDESNADDALRRMERVDREPNRHFLGRIPLVEEAPGLFTPARSDAKRQAAWAKLGERNSALTQWIAEDPHLGPFLTIPAKENGFDVEGLAVRGNRIWLGLRGPVLRGHAMVVCLLKSDPP